MESYIKESVLIINKNFNFDNIKKVAFFDFDSTLCKYFGENKMSMWEYQYENVPEVIKNLVLKDYRIIVVSNQSLLREENLLGEFKKKIHSFINDLDIPILVFASLKRDKYRKPGVGLKEHLERYFSFSKLEDAFFVGDAAGPRKYTGYKSYCDLKFAYNLNVKFYTPEEYFLNLPKDYSFTPLNIREHRDGSFENTQVRIVFLFHKKKHSGTSFFIKKYYGNFEVRKKKVLVPKSIYINCNDINFITTAEESFKDDVMFIFLDYPNEIIEWIKGFSYLNGFYKSKKFVAPKKSILDYLQNKLIRVPFIFDDSNYSQEMKELLDLQV